MQRSGKRIFLSAVYPGVYDTVTTINYGTPLHIEGLYAGFDDFVELSLNLTAVGF